MILELLPDGEMFLLRAGVGWKDGWVGQARVDAGQDSQPGYSLLSGEPVVSENLNKDPRFHVAEFLTEHGVVGCMTVLIHGHNRPFGILGAATSRERVFTEEEVHFLLAVSSVLAMAIERHRTEPELQKLAAFGKFNPSPVLEFSNEGNLIFFNDAAHKIAGLLGESHPQALLPPDTVGIVQSCLATGQNRLHLETRPGQRLLNWSFYPIQASAVVHCYVEDTTERTGLEEQLRQAQRWSPSASWPPGSRMTSTIS